MSTQILSKKCTRCEASKPCTGFYTKKGYKNNLDTWCKTCRKDFQLEWSKKNRDKVNKTKKRYRKNNPLAKKRQHLKRDYGISLEDYFDLFDKQKGVCASCGEPETAKQKGSTEPQFLAVDHDHETGEIRGLLCGRCNTALGLLKDSPERITKLLHYLTSVNSGGII